MKEFYTRKLEMEIWLEQAECCILKHGNLLLGFCKRDVPDVQGIITLFFESNEEVDRFYSRFRDSAEGAPIINERYRIYHFFTHDPEGRRLEFQRFLHELPRF
jgi:hypothetical protein